MERKKLIPVERGFFVAATAIRDAAYSKEKRDVQIEESDITLTYPQIRALYSQIPCPCGHCDYYDVEIFPDGRWISHHVSKGEVTRGTWK